MEQCAANQLDHLDVGDSGPAPVGFNLPIHPDEHSGVLRSVDLRRI